MTRKVCTLLLWFFVCLGITLLPQICSQAVEQGAEEENLEVHYEEDEDQQEESSGDEEGDSPDEEFPYFYAGIPDIPVIEFTLPLDEDIWSHYEFLLKPDPDTHRIVEFYAHWCPHCQHMRRHYIEFSKKLKQVSQHYNVPVQVYAVSCVPHRPVCQHFDVHAYPRIFLFPMGATEPMDIHLFELHPFQVLGKIGVELEEDVEEEVDEVVIQPSGLAPDQDFFLPRRKKDIYNDAYLSFQFAMKNGIFTHPGPLTNATKDHLLGFLDVLQSTLPPSLRLQKLAAEIVQHADVAFHSEEALIALVDKYPPKKKSWSHSCTRGDPAMGYTCGLWELFHIMSIGLVEFNMMVTTEDDYAFYRPADTAVVLRNFIENFFGCEVCRIHFLQAYDGCEYNGCERLVDYAGTLEEWTEFPIWLYEFHNGVNVRLMKERAEREGRTPTPQEEIAVQWPSRKDCPTCWHDDGRFDPTNTFIFLRLTYWPEDQFSERMRTNLIGSEYDKHQLRTSFLDRAVKGLQFIIVALVVIGAFWYEKRRRMKIIAKTKKNP